MDNEIVSNDRRLIVAVVVILLVAVAVLGAHHLVTLENFQVTVVDSAGRPVANVVIYLGDQEFKADKNGQLSLHVKPGRYDIAAWWDGHGGMYASQYTLEVDRFYWVSYVSDCGRYHLKDMTFVLDLSTSLMEVPVEPQAPWDSCSPPEFPVVTHPCDCQPSEPICETCTPPETPVATPTPVFQDQPTQPEGQVI